MLKSKVFEYFLYSKYSKKDPLHIRCQILLLLHKPVLLREILEHLPLFPGAVVIDATIGLGGHAQAMLQKIGPTGKLFGFDWDARNRALALENLSQYPNFTLVPYSFSHMQEQCEKLGVKQVDAILFDLGISSAHLDDASRGFSYRFEAPLDLRMDIQKKDTASDILEKYSEEELADIFWKYGEERGARTLAKEICEQRKVSPIRTTTDLFAVIERVHYKNPKKTASRIFQALRIVVNEELEEIETALPQAISLLKPKGRVGVISFHSLEDRLVKNIFREKHMFREENGKKRWQRVNKHVIIPSDTELSENPRSRSAKLRLLENISS